MTTKSVVLSAGLNRQDFLVTAPNEAIVDNIVAVEKIRKIDFSKRSLTMIFGIPLVSTALWNLNEGYTTYTYGWDHLWLLFSLLPGVGSYMYDYKQNVSRVMNYYGENFSRESTWGSVVRRFFGFGDRKETLLKKALVEETQFYYSDYGMSSRNRKSSHTKETFRNVFATNDKINLSVAKRLSTDPTHEVTDKAIFTRSGITIERTVEPVPALLWDDSIHTVFNAHGIKVEEVNREMQRSINKNNGR